MITLLMKSTMVIFTSSLMFFFKYLVQTCTGKKNESCVTQDKMVYLAKATFILARNDQSEINTVYCVELFLNRTKYSTFISQWWTFNNKVLND